MVIKDVILLEKIIVKLVFIMFVILIFELNINFLKRVNGLEVMFFFYNIK